ncbi:hypothetical protein CEY09_30495 [Achromobacter marplatensis]|uniref:Uncharacterized protein n=1 Tax=Achromobacter marplatensis TaxID=470868 RepID=A0ABX9FY98_9BURK|nr:hypothetical protein [Achromobacter marplatensis]OWT55320.1 hypothetical protein CEY09_30495 [Achromobacter marplatensis]RBP10662.1 hypothetical protein DFP87_12525 [Achromobacter marplatensis]CAB3713163.1 hypothetical protein LMG26219_06046 [Achromobacter marplatensis]
MADPIQQVTQINLPNPRTVLIRVPLPNGGEALGYPTREFMALLRQFTIRVGGTGGDVDIITPDSDIMPPLGGPLAAQDAALSVESLSMLGASGLQDLVAQAVSVEMQCMPGRTEPARPDLGEMVAGRSNLDSPFATETIFAAGYVPPQGGAAISVTASPMTYTASTREELHVAGGTVSAISFARGSLTLPVGVVPAGQFIELSPGDRVAITYTAAPTLNRIPR